MSDKHGAAHDDHHEAFDPEPATELGPDETPSPSWLPMVGGVLLLAAVGYVFYPGADAIAKAPEAPVASAAKPAAVAKPAPKDGKPAASARRPGKGDRLLPTKGAIKKAPPTK